MQNTPNPFSEVTSIRYETPEDIKSAKLVVTDLNGTLINSFTLEGVRGSVEVSKGIMKPGLYLYSLVANNEVVLSKKMIVE